MSPFIIYIGETTSDDQTNLDVENLAQDLETLLLSLYGDNDGRYLDKTGKEIGRGPPNIHLVGHSMGGSIVTELAYRNRVPNISSLFVLDMAEGKLFRLDEKVNKDEGTR